MAMDVFSANPRSFKMDRKSPLATELKASITQKLIEFIGNYTDDVLAEYIVVLVCNGKHQNQARDDLEAFLGERSGEFVSWLWNLLLKTVDQHQKPLGSSEVKDVNVTSGCDDDVHNKQRIYKMRDVQNHTITNANNLSSFLSTCAPKPVYSNDVEVSEGFQHCYPDFDVSLDEINTKEVLAQKFKCDVSKKYQSSEDNCYEGLKYGSSGMKGPSEISTGGEQSVQYVDQHKKTVHNNFNGLRHQLLYSPNRELASRNLQSMIAGNPHSRPFSTTNATGTLLSSRADNSVSRQNSRPRGNVWDRLGKPCDDNTIVRGKKIEVKDYDEIERNIVEHNREGLDQHRLMLSVVGSRLTRRSVGEVPSLNNSCGIVTSTTKPDDYSRLKHGLNELCLPHDANNSNRKRQFAEIGPAPTNGSVSLGDSKDRHLQDEQTYNEFQRLSSIKRSHLQSLSGVAYRTRKPGGLDTNHAFIAPNVALHPRANRMSQTKSISEASKVATAQNLVSNCIPLVTKSEAINSEEDVKTVLNPVQAQMLDVKLRLRHIETEMYKLRSKQIKKSNDGKLNSSSSFGALNHPEEDIKSRTVFVTNVHFAATKEALSLHFAKCGVVAKVIILNDTVTAQPKGSAYITFASKESADKAVALSGTSFWSRTLKVVKKAEMSVVAKAPVQMGGNVSQLQLPQPNRKVVVGRPYTSSHLQWRRDQPVNAGGHSGSSPGGGLEASKVVEQNGTTVRSDDVGSMETRVGV